MNELTVRLSKNKEGHPMLIFESEECGEKHPHFVVPIQIEGYRVGLTIGDSYISFEFDEHVDITATYSVYNTFWRMFKYTGEEQDHLIEDVND